MVDNMDHWEYPSEYVFGMKLYNDMVCILC